MRAVQPVVSPISVSAVSTHLENQGDLVENTQLCTSSVDSAVSTESPVAQHLVSAATCSTSTQTMYPQLSVTSAVLSCSDSDLYFRTLVGHDHTYSNYSSESIATLKLKIQEMGEKYEKKLASKRSCIKQLRDTLRRKVAKLDEVSELLCQLQNENLIDCEIKTKLALRFSGLKLALINNELTNMDKKMQESMKMM